MKCRRPVALQLRGEYRLTPEKTMAIEDPNLSSVETDNNKTSSTNSRKSLLDLQTSGDRVCQVLLPVTLCSIYVTLLVKLSGYDLTESDSIMARAWSRLGLITTPKEELPIGRAVLGSLYSVLIFLALIVGITMIMLFVLYMEWHRCLSYYFYLPSFIIMSIITPAYLRLILQSLGGPSLDLITLAILVWNFVLLGMMSIFGLYAPGPLILQQSFLIHNSSILAVLMISFLPGWAPWLLLGFLVVWDLFAVMTPYGPLNLILNMAEKRGIINMPGLIYSTDIPPEEEEESVRDKKLVQRQSIEDVTPAAKRSSKSAEHDESTNDTSDTQGSQIVAESESRRNRKPERPAKRKSIEEKGVDIGLGDFIFYGLLVGVTTKGQEYYTTLAALISIQIGLIATLAILTLTRRALPALPISIALGLLTAGLSMRFVPALADGLAHEQIFI